jgi:hypothetical protein
LLKDVADLLGVELDGALLKTIKKKAETLSEKRNLLALHLDTRPRRRVGRS